MLRIALVSLLALVALSPVVWAADAPVRTISVSGSAERKVAPDEAHIMVTLGAIRPKVAAAKALHDDKLRKLFAIAEKNGIPKKHISTQSSSVQPVYSYETNRQVFRGYQVVTTVDLKVSSLDKVGALMEQIASSGLEEANQQEYGPLLSASYSISKPEEIRDEMLSEAIGKARAKASRMAAAAGTGIGRVYQINESEAPVFQPMPMMEMSVAKASDGMAAAPPVAPPPGEQSLRSTVSVVFELKD